MSSLIGSFERCKQQSRCHRVQRDELQVDAEIFRHTKKHSLGGDTFSLLTFSDFRDRNGIGALPVASIEQFLHARSFRSFCFRVSIQRLLLNELKEKNKYILNVSVRCRKKEEENSSCSGMRRNKY